MATQVPYRGEPEVAPQGGALPQVHEDTPAAAFGGTVAAAVQHLGETVEGAGKELFQRAYGFQEMDQQIKADAAAAEYMDKTTQRYLEFDQLKGNERVAGMKQYTDDLQKMREQGGADLESPYAKQRFLQESRQTQSRMLWHGGVLARQGQDEAAAAAAQGKVNAAVQQYSTVDPADPKELDKSVATIQDAIAERVHQKTGFAPGSEENKNASAPLVSSEVSKMLLAKANSDPVAAKKLFERSKSNGLLTPEDADKLDQKIELAVNGKLGRKIGAQVGADNALRREPPIEVAKRARLAAEKADPGNKDLADNAEDAAVARQNHEKQLEQASWRETQQTLLGAIDGSTTNGKVPLSLEEAQKDPRWAETYNSLPAPEQAKVREQILRNQNTNGWVPNEEGTRQFQNLYAALKDPRASAEEVDAALNVDLMATPMTREQRKTIMDLQATVLKDQSNQSTVNSAMNVAEVQQALRAAGISKKESPEEYTEFVTKFTDAIGEYANAAHRTVKDHKQLGEIANTMLMHQVGAHFWNSNSAPAYKDLFAARPDLKAKAFAEWKAAYGTEPTPEQLNALAPAFYKALFTDLGLKSRPATTKSNMRVQPKAAENKTVGEAR